MLFFGATKKVRMKKSRNYKSSNEKKLENLAEPNLIFFSHSPHSFPRAAGSLNRVFLFRTYIRTLFVDLFFVVNLPRVVKTKHRTFAIRFFKFLNERNGIQAALERSFSK